MTEIEKLILEVESRGLAGVNRELSTLDKRTATATSGWGKMRIGLAAVVTSAVAVTVALGGATAKLIESTKTYQRFDAMLKIATKSTENAAIATEALRDFAATTPYSVNEATQSFIKLINLGLTPSERALRSYGNTASSMGKSLNDMIEAVADASTGEFERLKEFGIKASQQGDRVKFTFQGVTTEVGRNAREIEAFLMRIGENQFAGAMEEQMKGLGGAMSNLGDTWEQLWISIAKQGPDSILAKGFAFATEALSDLNASISSGELRAKVKAYGMLWSNVTDGIVDSFINGAFKLIGLDLHTSAGEFLEFFRFLPVNAKAACEAVINYFINLFDRIGAALEDWTSSFAARFEQITSYAEAAGEAIYDFLFGDGDVDFGVRLDRIDRETEARIAAIEKERATRVTRANEVYDLTLAQIVRERDARIEAFEESMRAAEQLRADFEARAKTRAEQNRDALEQFAPTSYTSASNGKPASKGFESQVGFLEQGLESEMRVLEASYEERKNRVLEATSTTELEKRDLVLRLLFDSLMTEEQAIEEAYLTRRDFILASTETTERVKNALITQLTEEREKALANIEAASMSKRLEGAETFFGNLAQASKAFGEKGFKAFQAAAIAQATIKMYESATSAYASGVAAGGPYGIALGAVYAAAAIAAGAANIAAIKSQSYAGAFEHGGAIPGGKYGLVGEAGPEFVRGPAFVTSARETSRVSSRVPNITIHNNGQPVEARAELNGDELMLFLTPILAENRERTKNELSGEIERGGGRFSRTVEKRYGLQRATT
jgi:Tape measure protein